MSTEPIYDIAIIGGGINGCGIARDAAGRGLTVYLCEMNDLASGTSSWSTKLIHGGLRYLEHYEFRLVREALVEREVLWGIAPHVIRPLRLVLPHKAGLRPAWLLRLGLFLYDHLGGRRKLPGTTRVALASDPAGKPLAPGVFSTAFEYSDCIVDDARLVVLNAMDARSAGAIIETRTCATRAQRRDGIWEVTVGRQGAHTSTTIRARILVNAAGPWVEKVLTEIAGATAKARIRLVQGSHIVVPRLYDHDRAYLLQNTDGRVVFTIPYLEDYTLIGTTDRDYPGDPEAAHATNEEVAYLCDAVCRNFAKPISARDVVWRFSGLRPLYDDGTNEAKAATRDYVFELDGGDAGAPLLSIFGGKITTYRRLAEHALERLLPFLPPDTARVAATKAGWTAKAPLPGGDFAVDRIAQLEAGLAAQFPFLSPPQVRRLVRSYGTRASAVLADARNAEDLGRDFGAGLTEAEVRYLMAEEWAHCADDIVWRRSKIGIRLSKAQIASLEHWIRARAADCGSERP